MAADELPATPLGSPFDPPMAPVPYTVRERRSETADTVSLVLAPVEGASHRPFHPGQFNMLYAFGVGEIAVSICGDPADTGRTVHTVRSVGTVSRALTEVAAGSSVGVRGPYGSGWPVESAHGQDVVIVAGGLGLPPLRPAIYEILRLRDQFGRLEVIYGARTPRDLVYYDEIQTWRARTDLRFQTTVDAAGREWYGDVGVVTTRLPDARFDPPRTTAFLCGPEIMMVRAARALEARGVPPARIFLSMERNMKCAIGLCGHCQFSSVFLCRDGPVLPYSTIKPLLAVREV